MTLLGVDTGGSTTRCVVVDAKLGFQGLGIAGPGNYRVAGTDGARENIEAAIEAALRDAGRPNPDQVIGGFGIASLDSEEDRRVITDFLEAIPLVDEYHVINDVVAAYYAFSAGEPGVVIIAGTGSMAFGRNADGVEARSGGWGWLFGDEGSGYDAARQGLQAASKAVDGRGPSTALVERACEHFDLTEFDDVFTEVMDEIEHAKDIASFAKPVAEAAAAGDPVAEALTEDLAGELAAAGRAVIERLELAPAPLVSLQGGFGSAPPVADLFEARIREDFPDASFAAPVAHPVIGSVAYAQLQREEIVDRQTLDELDEAVAAAMAAHRQ